MTFELTQTDHTLMNMQSIIVCACEYSKYSTLGGFRSFYGSPTCSYTDIVTH